MRLTIDQWRRLKNLSQEELGERCGVTKMTVRTWEKHPERVMFFNAKKISDALEVEIGDIIFLPEHTN